MFLSYVFFAFYPALDVDGIFGMSCFKKMSKRKKKIIFLCVAILLCVAHLCIEFCSDCKNRRQNDEQDKKIMRLQAHIELVGDKLSMATGQVARAEASLKVANETLASQSRSISSLIYNMDTSFEGKERFARCFDALSVFDEQCEYAVLPCDDGAAVFWFEENTEDLIGFYFYTNSEINDVLSGIPIGFAPKIENGRLLLQKGSEIALALERALDRKTPKYVREGVGRDLVLQFIDAQIGNFLRYVYRAEEYRMSLGQIEKHGETSVRHPAWCVTYRYRVSPSRADSISRCVEIWFEEKDFESLGDVSMREFSARLIAFCVARGYEPKIRMKDIVVMRKGYEEAERRSTFPYMPGKNTIPVLK